MNIILLLILFTYGIIIGSFFNVVGVRVPINTLFKEKRSYCDKCLRTLGWTELIPVWSYIFQKGRCKECKQKISILYPIMEILTGILFSYSYLQFGRSPSFILSFLLISLIIPVTVSDFTYQKIPNQILLFFIPVFIIYRLIYPIDFFWTSLAGALFAFTLVWLIIYLSDNGMGMGDLKYYTLFGFIFGVPQFLLLFFLSTFYGVIAGVTAMKMRNTGLKSRIAFGPYIGLAALTVHYFGETIIQWYIHIII